MARRGLGVGCRKVGVLRGLYLCSQGGCSSIVPVKERTTNQETRMSKDRLGMDFHQLDYEMVRARRRETAQFNADPVLNAFDHTVDGELAFMDYGSYTPEEAEGEFNTEGPVVMGTFKHNGRTFVVRVEEVVKCQ